MFQKFGKDIPQSLVDIVSGIMSEAKSDEPAAPDAEAIARRKRLQAIKDKQEDDAAERGSGEKKSSGARTVAGKAYGGSKQKDEPEQQDEETVNELSKNTMKSYKTKAVDAGLKSFDLATSAGNRGDMKRFTKHSKDLANRAKGIATASKKLGEDVESLDEGKLDKMTLSDLWHSHAHHSYGADQGYGGGQGGHHSHHAATAIENHVRKHYGNKVADDMVNHSDMHVAHAEYAGPKDSEKLEHDSAKLRTKHGITGNLYGMHAEEVIHEKSVSKAQQKFMGMVYKAKKSGNAASPAVAKAAKGMSKKAAHDFAATKHKGLPTHKEDSSSDMMNKRQQQYNQAEELELHLDLTEGKKKELDLPFTPDKPHGPIAKPGKGGYGPSAAKHLARLGLKGMKKETMMGAAPSNATGMGESHVAESRGHKILATKLRQLAAQSHGISPDVSTNAQNVKDKMKDAQNLKGVEIVKQKDTSIKKEEVEQIDELSTRTLVKYHNAAYNDLADRRSTIKGYSQFPKNQKKVDDARHRALNRQVGMVRAVKKLGSIPEETDRDKHFGAQSQKMQDAINLHLRKGKNYDDAVKAAKEHVKEEVVNELSKDTLTSYKNKATSDKEEHDDVKYDGDQSFSNRIKANWKGALRRKGIKLATNKLAKEDSKSPGQDEDDHMSPGATARN